MRTENVMYFTEKEEELVNLLIRIGIKKYVAKVLVYLANMPEATSRAIEHGTDLRQPEVSLAIQYLKDQGWITSQLNTDKSKGRPFKIYELAKSIVDIMDAIEKEKMKETTSQLAKIQKLRDYLH